MAQAIRGGAGVWGPAFSVAVGCGSGGGVSNAAAAALIVLGTVYGVLVLVLSIMYRCAIIETMVIITKIRIITMCRGTRCGVLVLVKYGVTTTTTTTIFNNNNNNNNNNNISGHPIRRLGYRHVPARPAASP